MRDLYEISRKKSDFRKNYYKPVLFPYYFCIIFACYYIGDK